MEENMLFAPSFPLESMDLLHLQRASLGPDRWMRLFAVPSHQKITPTHQATFDHPRSFGGDENDFKQLNFVPGGRYLLTLTPETLALVDLGVPWSEVTMSPEILGIATTMPQCDFKMMSSPIPCQDGRGVRVAAVAAHGQDTW